MIRSGILQLFNAFRMLFVIMLMTALFANTILTLMDLSSPDKIELAEENSESETEKEKETETEEIDTDEFINGNIGNCLQSQDKLAGMRENIRYQFNTHGEVTTPPPERA